MSNPFRLCSLARDQLHWLLSRLTPQEIHYIAGPEPLPQPLTAEEERKLVCRLHKDDGTVRSILIERDNEISDLRRELEKYKNGDRYVMTAAVEDYYRTEVALHFGDESACIGFRGCNYSADFVTASLGARAIVGETTGTAGMKSGDIQVHVIPKRKDKISYLPLTKKTSYVIVGLDPGTTVGLSILDLNGNLLHTASVRAQSPAEVIAEISRVGKPVVVATDKAEMPAGVEKIRRAFAAVPWTPKKDILIKEKYAAAEGYEFADDHQRDSLAAAVLAFRSFQPKFENLKKRLPAGTDIDFVRAGIIRGKTLDKILSAPVIRTDEETPEAEPEVFADEKDLEIARLEGEVAKLRKLIRGLSEDLEAKDKAVKKLQRRLSLERNERTADILLSEEITSRDRELAQTKKALRKEERRSKNLRIRLDRMKNYVALQAGDGCLAIKVMQLLSRDAVKSVDEEMGVNDGDILYVLKIDGWGKSVIRDLADAKIKAVIFPKLTYDRAREQHLIEEFRRINLPALSGVNLSPRVKGKIGVVNEAAFTKSLSEWDAAEEVFLKERRHEEFSGMVEEYQVQRRREVNVLGIDPATLPYNQTVPEVVQKPKVKPAPPVQEAPKPKPKPVLKKITVPETQKKAVQKEEPKTEDIFSAVLSAYRKERKKEMEKTENG